MSLSMRLNNISIRHKLVFLSLLILVALSVPTYLFYQSANQDINIIRSSLSGLPVARQGVDLAKLIAEHRGLSARYLNGEEVVRSSLVNKGNQIASNIAIFKQSLSKSGSVELELELQNIESIWSTLKTNVPQRLIPSRQSFEDHSLQIRQVQHLLETIIRHYQMTYLRSAASYNLVISGVVDLPKLADQLGKIRGYGGGILSSKTASQSDLAILNSYMIGMEQSLRNYDDHVNLAAEAGIKLPVRDSLIASAESLLQTAQTQIMEAESLTYNSGAFFDNATRIIGDFYAYNSNMKQLLDSLLQASLDDMLLRQRLSLMLIVIVMLTALGMFFLIARSIDNGVKRTVNALLNMADGDYNIKANVERQDEIGTIGRTLIEVAKKLKEFNQRSIEAIRVKQALDNSSTCYMIADSDRKIIYMNASVKSMLGKAEGDIRQDLPQFSIKNLLGRSIDDFHRNPHHQRAILDKLTDTYTTKIVLGDYTFRLIVNPIYNEQQKLMGHSVEWHDMTEYFEKERRITRLLESLDCTSTNVMIADADRKIIYLNKAVKRMMKTVEADLQQVMPHFDADSIMGRSMDDFHQNPAHQMSLLSELTSSYEANIKVGRRYFRLTANPIISEHGDRLGSVVEWIDRTKEIEAEQEIEQLVAAAVKGDFSNRASIDGKEGFQRILTDGLNKLLDITEQGLSEISRILLAVSEGDLTKQIDQDFDGTFEDLRTYCNKTSNSLAEIVSDIRIASSSMSITSSQIAQGNADLSHRTEQQASSLEETASSMEQMNVAVRNTATSAQQASALATQASEMATSGGIMVDGVVNTMAQINDSAKQIEDIISVIDGIAFQTNILALNAAVEAARAGEQGRGFAVVASEVRTLAQRSANSAKDIKALISDSVARIETGNDLVIQSGQSIAEVVEAVRQVSELVTDIAMASDEQASGIDEVNRAISGMDEMTQQNAALVEQAAAAAESMHALAKQLDDRVKTFDIGDVSIENSATTHALPNKTVKPARIGPVQDIDYNDDWESF